MVGIDDEMKAKAQEAFSMLLFESRVDNLAIREVAYTETPCSIWVFYTVVQPLRNGETLHINVQALSDRAQKPIYMMKDYSAFLMFRNISEFRVWQSTFAEGVQFGGSRKDSVEPSDMAFPGSGEIPPEPPW